MERVFLDANVLFSAAYAADSGLARLWRLRATTLITSSYAAEEAARNLDRDDQRGRLKALLAETESIASWPVIELAPGIALPDKDLPILLAAIAARATHLLTGDRRHFGKLFGKTAHGIAVLAPAEYLKTR